MKLPKFSLCDRQILRKIKFGNLVGQNLQFFAILETLHLDI